jgi:hypothetical protein
MIYQWNPEMMLIQSCLAFPITLKGTLLLQQRFLQFSSLEQVIDKA